MTIITSKYQALLGKCDEFTSFDAVKFQAQLCTRFMSIINA